MRYNIYNYIERSIIMENNNDYKKAVFLCMSVIAGLLAVLAVIGLTTDYFTNYRNEKFTHECQSLGFTSGVITWHRGYRSGWYEYTCQNGTQYVNALVDPQEHITAIQYTTTVKVQ